MVLIAINEKLGVTANTLQRILLRGKLSIHDVVNRHLTKEIVKTCYKIEKKLERDNKVIALEEYIQCLELWLSLDCPVKEAYKEAILLRELYLKIK